MVKILDNVKFGNEEYTCVDFLEYKGLSIICYLGEEYLFTYIKDGKEHVITDQKTIDDIKKEFGLDIPEFFYLINPIIHIMAKDIKEIKGLDLTHIKDYFLKLLVNAGIKVNKEKILSRLSKVTFIEGTAKAEAGFYHPATNSVVFPQFEENYNSKSTIVHEIIHACGGKGFNMKTAYSGFIEGSTELTTNKLLGMLYHRGESYNGLYFNKFYGSSYIHESAIINQMEYLLGEEVTESILLGKTDFFDKFKKKYGTNLFRYLKHRTTRFAKLDMFKLNDYFIETQKVLFRTVFDKEIKEVNSIESAKKYIERLKNFEYELGIVPNNEYIAGFVEYYNKKISDLEEMLIDMNLPRDEIDDLIKRSQHEKVVFRTSSTVKGSAKKAMSYIGALVDYIIENGIKLDRNGLDYYYGTSRNENIDHIITYNNVPIYHIKSTLERIQFSFPKENEIERTEKGFKTYSDCGDIQLKRIPNREAVDMLVEAINKEMKKRPNFNPDLLIDTEGLENKL